MTDDELLELVQTRSPEELTAEEVAELRQRLADSESLRTALFDTLQMEAYLSAALSSVRLKPEAIVERAHQFKTEQTRTWAWVLTIVAGTLALLALMGAYQFFGRTTEPIVAENSANDEKPEESDQKTSDNEKSNQLNPMPPAEKKEGDQQSSQPAEETKVERSEAKKPANPWDAVLTLANDDLPEFTEICFEDFAYRSFLPNREYVSQWFEPVPGQAFRVIDQDTKKGKCARIEGLGRLKAPLPADGGFRFALENYNHLEIQAWNGTEGVLLSYFEDQRSKWVAYAVTRKPGEAKVDTLRITATDDERARRAEVRYGGPLELRYKEGELMLLRGDIALVRAPLSQPPEEIYFNGKASFEGLTLVRTKGLPLESIDKPGPATELKPAKIAWTEKVAEGAKLDKSDDGSIRLTSREPKEPSYLFTKLPGYGYREVIFEITDPLPGFGVFLGNSEGKANEMIRVVRNTRTKRLNAILHPNHDFYEGDLPFYPERPEAIVGDRLWIKLLHGNGCLKWWLSVDGLHWAIGERILEDSPGGYTTIGFSTCRTKPESGATVRSIAVRGLPAINSLADSKLVEKTPEIDPNKGFESWHAKVVESCPAGVSLNEWRRACAIRSLGEGLLRVVAERILEAVLDDPATQALPFEQQREVLREVMLVDTDPRDGPGWKKSFVTRLHELGRRIAASGGLPFTSIRHVLMGASVWSQHPLPVAQEGEAEEELIALLQAGRTDEALALCELLRMYHFHENRPLFAWVEATARRETGRVTGETSRSKESWRHPLVEELNKEVYNFAADLHAMVDSGSLADASRMIASLEADRGGGLTPSGGDEDLFVSLDAAVKLAIAQQPGLRDQLTRQLGPLGQLRIRHAIASGDESTIHLAATQFEGTEAAAEAFRWLGDRALQNGWFARALADYRRAEKSAASSLKHEIAPRARLAAAMMGVDFGAPITENVSLGGTTMPAAEFEALVAEMRNRGPATVAGARSIMSGHIPEPTQFNPQNRARLDGPAGQNPHDDGAPRLSQYQIDYAGRQIATAIEGDVMYVSNRFQIAAYNATNGQRMWQSQAPAGEMRRGQDWALIPMQPLVTTTGIYARQLYGPSPCLVCFEKASGKKLWQRDGTDNEWWVSDPVFVQGQLLVLSLLREGNREMQLRLAAIDPISGEVLVQKRLMALRSSWLSRRQCEVAALDDGIVASLGGMMFSCDAAGNVRWVRKQMILPSEERPEWVHQYFQPPLVVEDRMLSVQPGVESLDCLEVATGQRVWTFTGERPRRILGSSNDRVIVETDKAIVALTMADGKVAWRKDVNDRILTAAAVGQRYVLFAIHRKTGDNNKTPVLVWLDANDGRYAGACELPNWKGVDPRLGPMVATKDRLWGFFSQEKDPNKDLVELVPGSPLTHVTPLASDAWQQTLSSQLVQTVQEVAPDWKLVAGYPRKDVEKKTAWNGENDAALILGSPSHPGAIVTEATIPAGKKSNLQLRFGHEGAQPGDLSVCVDGQTIMQLKRQPDNANRWESLDVNLERFAGKQVSIAVVWQPTGNDQPWWLKSARVSIE